MNKLIKPFTFIVALTIPVIASPEVNLSQLTENEVRVTYNADDAITNHGRIELERQIRNAAEQICGSQDLRRAGSIEQVVRNRNCYQKAVADALNTIKATARATSLGAS